MFVVLIASAAYFIRFNQVALGDPDTWWHIKTGQDIILNLRVPITDTYSHTFAGHSWIAKEWLSQVFFALAYNAAGWNGVLLLTALAAGLAISILYFELEKFLKPMLAAIVVFSIAFLIIPVVLARPHIFTFAIALIFTVRLFRSADAEKAPEYWLLALITLWANLHGSFTLAFVIAGFAFLAAMEKNRLADRALIGKWLVFLVLCPFAALINPYGLQPFVINLGLISGIQAMTLIIEWQPFNAPNEPFVETGLLAVIGVLAISGVRLTFSKTLFMLFTLHMMLNHIRFMYVFFLLVPIFILQEVVKKNPKLSREHWLMQHRDKFENFVAKWLWPILSIGTVASLAVFLFNATNTPYAPPPDRRADGAFAYIKSHHLEGPVMNTYDFGGPLILNNIKTFIDGRAEQLFLGDFLKNYVDSGAAGGEKKFETILETYKIAWTMLVPSDLRNQYLAAMPNWKKTYADEYTVIFERN
jgi:hypothetical protein